MEQASWQNLGDWRIFALMSLRVEKMMMSFYYIYIYMESMENPQKRLSESKVSQTFYSQKDCGSLARSYQQLPRWISVPPAKHVEIVVFKELSFYRSRWDGWWHG